MSNYSKLLQANLQPLQALDIFDNERLFISLEDCVEFKQQPILPVSGKNPLVFSLPATTQMWTSPEMYINFGVKVTKLPSSEAEKALAKDATGYIDVPSSEAFSLSMLPAQTMFSDCQVSVNDLVLTSRTNLYPYVGYLKRVHLTSQEETPLYEALEMSYFDPVGKVTEASNEMAKKRKAKVQTGKICYMRAQLFGGILNQDKYILPGVNINITLTQTSDKFRILSDVVGAVYKCEIVSATLSGHKVMCNPQLYLMTMQALKKQPARYNFVRYEPSVFQIPSGQSTYTRTITLPNGVVPRTIFLMTMKTESVYGDFLQSPYAMDTMTDAEECYISVEDKIYPPYKYIQEDGNLQMYHDYKEACSQLMNGRQNSITLGQFSADYAVLAFRLDRFGNSSRPRQDGITLPRVGHASLHIKRKSSDTTTNVVLICVYNNCVTFNEALTPHADYIN